VVTEQVTVITSAQAKAALDAEDCALVAFFTGWCHGPHGNGVGYAPAYDALPRLVAQGFVHSEPRGGLATPLVWLTEEGHGVVQDIIEEGGFDAHIALLKSEAAQRAAVSARF